MFVRSLLQILLAAESGGKTSTAALLRQRLLISKDDECDLY